MRFYYMLSLCLVMIFMSCSRGRGDEGGKAMKFYDDVVIKTTPVRSQGRSPLCWAYAMLATIESDRLMKGDSVSLSPGYLARLWLQEQARTCYLTRGKRRPSLRGMATMPLRLMERYGMVPYDNYFPKVGVNYNVLCRTAVEVARASVSLKMLDDRLGDILDKEIGFLPPNIFMLGASYTPRQFAQSVCLPGEYKALTSFTHHPFGEAFVLESPDNLLLDTYYNMPIDSLMDTIVNALRHGHAVCWEGDISEPGFSFKRGVAVLGGNGDAASTASRSRYTQAARQRAFERHETTDDHCMELCGLAHDGKGNRYFIAKNSWGRRNPYGGFMYLSYDYVKMKTIAVVLDPGLGDVKQLFR